MSLVAKMMHGSGLLSWSPVHPKAWITTSSLLNFLQKHLTTPHALLLFSGATDALYETMSPDSSPFSRYFIEWVQPIATGASFLFLSMLAFVFLLSLTCSRNPFHKQRALQRKLFFFILLNGLCRALQNLVLNLLCPDLKELREERSWCNEWPSPAHNSFIHISVEKLTMCLDWISSACGFFTYLSLTFFWIEQYMSLQNLASSSTYHGSRRGSLVTVNPESPVPDSAPGPSQLPLPSSPTSPTPYIGFSDSYSFGTNNQQLNDEKNDQHQDSSTSSSTSSPMLYTSAQVAPSNPLWMRVKRSMNRLTFISLVFWFLIGAVTIVCLGACLVFFFTNIRYESYSFFIPRLVYRVTLSLICSLGILYFGAKISILFKNQYNRMLLKIALITVVCSLSYILLSLWNVISFVLYRVIQFQRGDNPLTTMSVAFFSLVELFANAILLFALTPDTLLCCCRNKQRRRQKGNVDSSNLYQETESQVSNDLGESLLNNEEEEYYV